MELVWVKIVYYSRVFIMQRFFLEVIFFENCVIIKFKTLSLEIVKKIDVGLSLYEIEI